MDPRALVNVTMFFMLRVLVIAGSKASIKLIISSFVTFFSLIPCPFYILLYPFLFSKQQLDIYKRRDALQAV